MKKTYYFLMSLLLACFILNAQPIITNVIPDETNIGKYQKLELTVNLTANYTNPYDYAQFNLKAIFIAPSGKKDTVDGFYYQDFTVHNNEPGNFYTLINGSPTWKIRFTPTETGNYQYLVYCVDMDGTSNTVAQNFNCISSASKGFIRKSNGNYMKYDDGTQYFPIGANYCWWMNNPLGNYQTWLDSLSTYGGNFIRIFMAQWSFGIEWSADWHNTGLGNYTNRQENAYWLDWVIEYSRQKQIFIELCLNNSDWGASSYNAVNGGPCQSSWDFFTNPTAEIYYKNKLRYIIARWGCSPNIFSWEEYNEIDFYDLEDNKYDEKAEEVHQWTNEMAIYMKNLDVNKHLISTSCANSIYDSVIWKLPVIDYTQTHYYSSDPELESLINSGAKNYLNEYSKPTKNGEFGLFTDLNVINTLDPTGIYVHNVAWNTALSGAFGIGMSWWWDSYIHPHQIYKHYKVLSDFVSSADLLSNIFTSKNLVCQSDSNTTYNVIPINYYMNKSPSHDFTVTTQGELIPNINKLNKNLFINDKNNSPTFHVNYIRDGVFKVKIGQTGISPKIEIWLDDKLILSQPAVSNSTYSISVPAGEHSILVNNNGNDWMNIAEYTFVNYVPEIKSTALVSSEQVYGWVHNRKYNWKNVYENGIPDTIQNAKIIVDGLDDGVYSTDWKNCQTGDVFSATTSTSFNGEMEISCPDFLWDCAYKSKVILAGSTNVCKGQTVTYTIPEIPNATSYIWTLPPGATGTSTTNSITVNYGTSAVSGNITVKGHNNSGNSEESTFAITVNSILSDAGPISGSTTVCQGQNDVAYSIPVIPNAAFYIWTLPAGATGSSSTNSITVNYDLSSVSGNISVKGHNVCGDGIASTLAIKVNQQTTTFNIVPMFGYWSKSPANDFIVTTQGELVPGNSILSKYLFGNVWNTQYRNPPTFHVNLQNSGIFTVKTSQFTGTLPTIEIWLDGNLYLNQPADINSTYSIDIPAGSHSILVDNKGTDWIEIAKFVLDIYSSAGIIAGTSVVCQGQNSVIYTIPALDNTGPYTWTLPSGATGTSTTNSISVNYDKFALSGYIIGKSHNICGDVTSSSMPVEVNLMPPTPSISLTVNILHSDALTGNQWYDKDGAIADSTSQDFTPKLSGDYYVLVTVNGCTSDTSNTINYNPAIINKVESENNIKIYPNPATNELNIEIKGNSNKTEFDILNSLGQIVYNGFLFEKTSVQVSSFKPGIYLIKFKSGVAFATMKVLKN